MNRRSDIAARCCNGCGGKDTMARFENEPFTIAHAGQDETIDGLSGWRCKSCGEVVFDSDDARRYAAAGDAMVLQARSA